MHLQKFRKFHKSIKLRVPMDATEKNTPKNLMYFLLVALCFTKPQEEDTTQILVVK